MFNNGLHIPQALSVQCFAQIFQMIFITAVLNKMCNSSLCQCRLTDVIHPFYKLYFFQKFSRQSPSNTITRCQRFGQRRTMYNQPFGIIIFTSTRPPFAKKSFSINLIFNHRDMVFRNQLHQSFFILFRHQPTAGVIKIGRRYTSFYFIILNCFL